MQAAINTTVLARAMLSIWLLCTGETIHIALANYDLFLPVVDRIDLVLSALSQLADFPNHDLQLQDIIVSLLVHLMKLLDFLLHFLFLWECAQLPVDALYIELTSKV